MDERLYSIRQGERFCYDTIDVDALRKLPLLQDWLKKNHRTRARMLSEPMADSHHFPSGHPRLFRYLPQNWRGEINGVAVIPDPDNIAYADVEYAKKNHYAPEVSWAEKRPGTEDNRYYVVTRVGCNDLWKPLPWDHVRMQLWEMDHYLTHNHCYRGHDGETFFHPRLWASSKVIEPKIDPHWKDEYIEEVQQQYLKDKTAEEAEHNQYASKWATPEQHLAVIEIRRRYPDYQPNLALINDPHSSPVYPLLKDRWFYLYASPEDMENDPILEMKRQVRSYPR